MNQRGVIFISVDSYHHYHLEPLYRMNGETGRVKMLGLVTLTVVALITVAFGFAIVVQAIDTNKMTLRRCQ